jgi:hypothetical protein
MRITRAVILLVLAKSRPAFSQTTSTDLDRAIRQKVDATAYSDAHGFADTLGAAGNAPIPLLIQGTQDGKWIVRDVCYRQLQERFPSDSRSIEANIKGLDDPENGWINANCALFLARQKIASSTTRLAEIALTEGKETIVRFACAQALAELGQADAFRMLYDGLGSDSPHVRHFSNAGVKALCGKDLAAFGYDKPSEDAWLSGSSVVRPNDPALAADWKAKRWKAIAAFVTWLKADKPGLYASLK